MNETELENLIVRLTGDGSGLSGMYAKAEKDTDRFAKTAEKAQKKVTGLVGQLKNMADAFVTSLAATKVRDWISEGISAWDEQEDAILKVTAIMKANGTYTESLMRDYDEFSSTVQDLTRHADETTLALLGQAESFGLTGEAAKNASQHAIAFAEINGGSAQAYLRFTAAMEKGDGEMMKRMARMIPQLRGIKDETELVAKAQRLVAAGWELAQQRAKTFTGQMEQLKNAYSDFMEDIGKITGDMVKPLVTGVKEIVNWMKTWSDSNKRIVVYIALAAASVLSVVGALASLKAVGAPIVAFLTSGFGLIASAVAAIGTGPLLAIVAGVTAVAAATYRWVQGVGGLGAAWEIVKDKALDAWDWVQRRANEIWTFLRPFFDWLGTAWDVFSDAALDAISYVWDQLKAFIAWVRPVFLAWFGFLSAQWKLAYNIVKAVWDQIVLVFEMVDRFVQDTVGGWGVLFGAIFRTITLGIFNFGGSFKDTLVDAFILGEFLIVRWKSVWNLAVATAAFKMVEFGNVVSFFFGTTAPALLNYFRSNWLSVFNTVGRTALAVFNELSFDNLHRIITGQTNFAASAARLAVAMGNAVANIPPITLPVRIPTALENQLRQEFEQLAAGVGASWAEFRERRLREISQTDPQRLRDVRRNGENLGNSFGDGFNRAVLKQLEKFDAALVNSAESMTRLFTYYLMRTGRLESKGDGHGVSLQTGADAGNDATRIFNNLRGGGSGAGALGGGASSIPGPAQAQQQQQDNLRPLFTQMRDLILAIKTKIVDQAQQQPQQAAQINLVPADLA